MSDLTSMIDKAAREVYSQLFETSELLAANRGSTLFVQRLYQAHGDLKDNVREDTEQFLLEASTTATAFDPLFRRDQDFMRCAIAPSASFSIVCRTMWIRSRLRIPEWRQPPKSRSGYWMSTSSNARSGSQAKWWDLTASN